MSQNSVGSRYKIQYHSNHNHTRFMKFLIVKYHKPGPSQYNSLISLEPCNIFTLISPSFLYVCQINEVH